MRAALPARICELHMRMGGLKKNPDGFRLEEEIRKVLKQEKFGVSRLSPYEIWEIYKRSRKAAITILKSE